MTAKKLALMFLMITLITQCLTEVYEKYFFLFTDKNDLLSSAGGVTPAGPSRRPTSPNIFWKLIFFKIMHQSGQLFLNEEIKWDQNMLKATRLAVSFLRNCILKILILNRKYK